MKYLTLFLFAFISCNQMRYHNKFDAYSDSADCYSEKFIKYLQVNKDSSDYYYFKESSAVDSLNKYYYLMHPNDNKCNCK